MLGHKAVYTERPLLLVIGAFKSAFDWQTTSCPWCCSSPSLQRPTDCSLCMLGFFVIEGLLVGDDLDEKQCREDTPHEML